MALWSLASAAQEATGTLILLDLPEGATITVDGIPVTPEYDGHRGQSLSVSQGTVRVRVEAPGEGRSEARAEVESGSVTILTYREGSFSRERMARALMLPGSAELSGGRPIIGGAIVLGLAGSVGGALWASGQLSEANAAAETEALRYDAARSEADAVAAREGHALAVEDAESARNTRAAFVAAGVAAYALAALDAYLFHSRSSELEVAAPRRPIIAFRPSGAGVSLQIGL